MNYLAHLSLSHYCKEVMLGNFMGDCVKGSDYDRYKPRVRRGLLLHRMIDSFTDHHATARETTRLFVPAYGHYAGIITDMVYDHILAREWSTYYPEISLESFVSRTHKLLLFNYFRLPGKLRKVLPFLIKSRRLESYAEYSGLARSLDIMSRNTSLPDRTADAIAQLTIHHDEITQQFRSFFAELQAMVDNELRDLNLPHDLL